MNFDGYDFAMSSLAGVVAVAMALLIFFLGTSIAEIDIQQACDKQGSFIGPTGEVYECRKLPE